MRWQVEEMDAGMWTIVGVDGRGRTLAATGLIFSTRVDATRDLREHYQRPSREEQKK